MGDDRVRFSAFIQEQKPSVQKMRVVRLLGKFDKTRGEVYVKDPREFKDHLNDILFRHSLDLDGVKNKVAGHSDKETYYTDNI